MRPLPGIIFRRGECHYSVTTAGFQSIWHNLCESFISERYSCLVLKHLFYLSKFLKESLLTGKHNQAIACLVGMAKRCYSLPELFFMVGLEMLKTMPSTHGLCVQFYKNAFLACQFHQQEILLNFALYLVERHHDITEGLELLKSKSSIAAFNNNLMHQAYMGLFEHLLSQPRQTCRHFENDIDEEHNDEFMENFEQIPIHNFSADHAINLFENVFNAPGVWDIFIPAKLYLETNFKSSSHAKAFLQKYRDTNKLNPNAHRYFRRFLQENSGTDKELLTVLEDLLQLDPTSELLDDLITLKLRTGDRSNITQLYFQKLDHAACRMDKGTWAALVNFLAENKKEDVVRKEVQLLWEERESWWPSYHFCIPQNLDIVGDSAVMLAKANVAEYVLGENTFSNKVFSLCGVKRAVATDASDDSATSTKRSDRKRKISHDNIGEKPREQASKRNKIAPLYITN